MRAVAILGVAHSLSESLLWAHCRLLACYLNAGFVARAPRAFGLWCCICCSSRAVCRMRTGLMMMIASPSSPFPSPETPVFTESLVSPPSPWSLVSSGSPPETVWYDSDIEEVHCVSGGATSNRESRDLSSLGNLSSVSR